jgi:protein-tyrosine phosphatase
MTSILLVCTGNICRSPIAEGVLRSLLDTRFGANAIAVSSAGTSGWEDIGATEEAVLAAQERGFDISAHRSRLLRVGMIKEADLVVTMAAEHRDEIAEMLPGYSDRTFTLKEIVRILEELESIPAPSPAEMSPRVQEAASARRRGFVGRPLDEDVADPLGHPFESYRAIAWELETWTDRLVDGLFGPLPADLREGA